MGELEGVNDQNVTKIINRYLQDAKRKWVASFGKEDLVKQVEKAFGDLRAKRQAEAVEDTPDLAAAEHYMFARWVAGKTGDPLVKAAPALYDLKKKLYRALGVQQKMQVTSKPVMAPNPRITWWGTKGATEGLADYERIHGRRAINVGKARTTLSEHTYQQK